VNELPFSHILIKFLLFLFFIIGGAMGSPYTLTLANIFMWKWEKQAILSKLHSNEIYGR
jgi:hypothetical protein